MGIVKCDDSVFSVPTMCSKHKIIFYYPLLAPFQERSADLGVKFGNISKQLASSFGKISKGPKQ